MRWEPRRAPTARRSPQAPERIQRTAHQPRRGARKSMEIGVAGLGRMGAGMARRLARGGHQVVAWNRHAQDAQDLAGEAVNGWRDAGEDPLEQRGAAMPGP